MADAINGRFPVRRTADGRFWVDIGDNLPDGQAGEAAFAASGTCVATQGEPTPGSRPAAPSTRASSAPPTGGSPGPRRGLPIAQGTGGAGVFSVAFRDALHGVVGGGDFESDGAGSGNFAVSSDGGKTWDHRTNAPINGAIFGLSYAAEHDQGPNLKRVVATGPDGVA